MVPALREWSLRTWPGLVEPTLVTFDVWFAANRAVAQIVYSLLMDLAIAFGEMLVARRPECAWSVDLDPERGEDGEISWKRCVVARPRGGKLPVPIVFDFEYIVVGTFFSAYPKFRTDRAEHVQRLAVSLPNLARAFGEAVAGDHERYWLEQP